MDELVRAVDGNVHALQVGHQYRDRNDQADQEHRRRDHGDVLQRALPGLDAIGPFAPARQAPKKEVTTHAAPAAQAAHLPVRHKKSGPYIDSTQSAVQSMPIINR